MPLPGGAAGGNTSVFTANNAGAQLFVVPYYQNAAGTLATGSYVGTLNIGTDTTGNTISIYDGTSTSGVLRTRLITLANQAAQAFPLNFACNIGAFFVLSGGTTPNVTVTWG